MKQKYNIYLTRVSKYLLVLILLVSGISKIIDPEFALEVLKAFNLFNESINIFIISILPILEIILAVMLLLNYKIRFTNISTIILFFTFFVISIWGYLLGLDKDCGCFGELIESSFGISMIIRNFFLLLLTFIVFRNQNVCAGKIKSTI